MNEEKMTKEQAPKKGTAVLVLGIISIVTVLFVVNYLFALIALIIGIVFLVKNKEYALRKRVVTGVALSVLSIIASTCLWVGVYVYFTTTDFNTMLKDVSGVVENVTGGEVNLEQTVTDTVNEAIESVVADVPEIEQVEQVLGKEINYDTIKEFVGEDLNLEKIQNFVGDGIDATKITEIAETVDYQAVMESLDNELTYEKLEEKVGEDFTYDELIEYLSQYQIQQ